LESLEKDAPLNQNNIWISRLIKQFSTKKSKEWLKEQKEDLFLFLSGINQNFSLKAEKDEDIENLLYLVIQLRLTGGVPINFQKKDDDFLFFINPDFSFIEKKEAVKDLAILTCNRPELLKYTLEKYSENISKFAHSNIVITVFDDSEEEQGLLNRKIVKELQKNSIKIKYLAKKQKNILISDLINKAKITYPKLASDKFYRYIPYTFGGEGIKPSYGRNRNFVSLFYQEKSFIMIDDDSAPIVQTISENQLFSAIKKMLKSGENELSKIHNYLPKKEIIEINYLDVDFIGYFNRTRKEIPQYVKYSGAKDMGADFRLLKQWGISPFEAGAKSLIPPKISKDSFSKIIEDLESDLFIYGEESEQIPIIKGLCCYFPPKSNGLRVTIPEDIRIEDLILGVNYFFYYKKSPIETNFSLFHQKTIRNITTEYIHQEIFAGLVFSIYLELLKSLNKEDLEKDLSLFYYRARINWKIADNIFNIYKENNDKMLAIFNNCRLIAEKSGNIDLSEKIKHFNDSLWQTFYGQKKDEYEKKINDEVNRILKEFCECLILWMTIKNIPLNDFG